MTLPKIDPSIQKTLILTGITVVGSMLVVSWRHHCARKTILYDHCLWKERLTLLSQQQNANEEDLFINTESGGA
jgi:hypothetical protein